MVAKVRRVREPLVQDGVEPGREKLVSGRSGVLYSVRTTGDVVGV